MEKFEPPSKICALKSGTIGTEKSKLLQYVAEEHIRAGDKVIVLDGKGNIIME